MEIETGAAVATTHTTTASASYPHVVVVPTQGLCNRLRALASGYVLAQHWKTRLFVVWKKEECCNCEWTDVFRSRFDTVALEDVSKTSHLYAPHVHTSNLLASFTDLSAYRYLVVIGGHEFKFPSMSPLAFLHRKIEFYGSLRFSPAVTDRLDGFVATHGLAEGKVVGVHFRDYVPKFDAADNYDFATASPLEGFVELVRRVGLSQPATRFFLSSNTDRAYAALSRALPKERLLRFSDTDDSRDSARGIVHAVCDLLALSRCAYLIGTHSSSFSDEACFFRGISKLCVRSSIDATTPMAVYHCHGFTELWGHQMLLPDVNILFDIYKEGGAAVSSIAEEEEEKESDVQTVHDD